MKARRQEKENPAARHVSSNSGSVDLMETMKPFWQGNKPELMPNRTVSSAGTAAPAPSSVARCATRCATRCPAGPAPPAAPAGRAAPAARPLSASRRTRGPATSRRRPARPPCPLRTGRRRQYSGGSERSTDTFRSVTEWQKVVV